MRRCLLACWMACSICSASDASPWPGLEPVTWGTVVSDCQAPLPISDPFFASGSERDALIKALDNSLAYLRTPKAMRDYEASAGKVAMAWVERSLSRFRRLLSAHQDPDAFQEAIRKEFLPYRMKGQDNQGSVAFTGYFEASAEASRKPNSQYRFPIYRKPPDLNKWSKPHPTRLDLEGRDALQGPKGRLKGLELVWLKDRLEAFLLQVQGSGRLRLTDGSEMTVGFGGATDHPYVSVGKELERDLLQREERRTLNGVNDYFRTHPESMDEYLPRNPRFVFFRETGGASPRGSLSIPVTGGRSIATDKTQFPPGAVVLIHAEIPVPASDTRMERSWSARFVLDQDSGSAIQGAGRIDLFAGGGLEGRTIAGGINSPGRAYYLLLRE
jgi:membrane-bound lytic murein transglycosylase A